MNNSPSADEQAPHAKPGDNARIIIAVSLALTGVGLLIVLAVVLAANARTAGPSVKVVRDLVIIFMSLEVVIIGAALAIFLVQLARLINLVRNEVEPLIDATRETINTVRGTALFLSKNVVEPVTNVSSVIRGLGKVAGDVDVIRKAASIVTEVASAATPTSATTSAARKGRAPRVEEEPDESEVSAPTRSAKRRRKPTLGS